MNRAAQMLRGSAILLSGILFQATCLAEGSLFDAASVRVSTPDAPKTPQFSGGPGTGDPGRLIAHINMSSLLQAAFGVDVDRIRGPAWLRDFSAMPSYDIIATMPAGTTKEQVEEMLRNLLVERFHLVFHQETGYSPGYELVADKGGPKLKEAAADPGLVNDPQPAMSARIGSDGFPSAPGPRTMGWRPLTAHQRIKYQERNMAAFVAQLGFLIGNAQARSATDGFLQPRVVDKTGLTGNYTFILEYECAACVPLATSPAHDNPDTGDPGGFPNIFVAIQSQLGLKLNKTADVPLDVIVIERLDRIPTEN